MAASTTCAHTATLRVGPDEKITRIADAARQAKDGDTVEIFPGKYRGDVAVWLQKHLTIRGIGLRPVLIADGKIAEGKAIWVIRNGDFRIENVEFRGARASDNNGAGIRFEQGKLVVRDCSFVDNQNGILTSNQGDGELVIENSVFAEAPRDKPILQHLLYIGRIASVTIIGSRFHGGYHGHLIKSRARRSDIRYNLIHDSPNGEASYEIDLPNGGIATLIGNIVGQSARTQNPVVISYGEEGKNWPESRLSVVHNTLINHRQLGAWFLRVPVDKFDTPPSVRAYNNLTVGLGVFSVGANGDFRGNAPALASMLNDAAILDFGLSRYSPLRWWFVVDVGQLDAALVPLSEFTLPIGTRSLTPPVQWAPGALQTRHP